MCLVTDPHQRSGASSHYNDDIMSSLASQITSLTIVYSTVYSRAGQRKHQSPASLAFVWGIHRWPVTGEFLAQRASNAENASIWWRHHEILTQINLQICHCGHAFCGFTYSQLLIWGARKWPLLLTYLTLISVWTSNCIHYKVWGETTYPFPKLQQCNRSTE